MTEHGSSPATGDRAKEATNPKSGRNVVSSWGSFILTVGINLFLTPFIVRTLGDTAYGIWVLLASVVGYMGLLDLGVRSAVMRYVAKYHARHADLDASQFASTGLAIFLVMGAIATVASLILATFLPSLFDLQDDFVGPARIVLVIGGISVGSALVAGVFGGVVSAMQRFYLRSYIGMAIGGLRALGVFAALSLGYGLVGLSLVQLGATWLQMVAEWFLTRRLYPALSLSRAHVRRDLVREIFSFAAFSSLLYASRSIILSASTVIIGLFLPASRITFFAIAASLVTYTRPIIGAIAQTVTPRASALQSLDKEEELSRVVLSLSRVASLVVAPIAITFALRGATFIEIWMGPEYRELSGSVLLVLTCALVVTAPGQILWSSLMGMHRHKHLVPFTASEALLNIIMSVALIRGWGIMGVAWGNSVPTLLIGGSALFVLHRRFLGATPLQVGTQIFLRPWLSMVPFALASAWIEQAWPTSNLALYFGQVALTLPAAAVGAYFVALDDTERGAVLEKLRGTLVRQPGRSSASA